MVARRNQRWENVKKGDLDLGVAIQHFDTYNRSEGKSPRTVQLDVVVGAGVPVGIRREHAVHVVDALEALDGRRHVGRAGLALEDGGSNRLF